MRRNAYFALGFVFLSALACSANQGTTGGGLDSGSGASGGSGGSENAAGTGGAAGTINTSVGAGAVTGSGGTISVGGNVGTAGSAGGGNLAQTCDGKLKGYIRDFTPAHVDFEIAATDLPATYPPRPAGKMFVHETGIVAPSLEPDTFKPIYAKDPTTGSLTTSGKMNFDQWFRDTDGVNMGTEYELQFVDPENDGLFTFDNGGMQFFPIDNQLLGNYPEYKTHNFHMTLELHSKFVYKPGMVFTFSGDDDVWVFINNNLVVDLGGVHVKMEQSVNLDTLGLTAGAEYQLDFFWAERHIVDSNFRIDTSIEFIDCGIVVVK